MRPLHEVLPLVRAEMWDGRSGFHDLRSEYVCCSAELAFEKGSINCDECSAMRRAVLEEIRQQSGEYQTNLLASLLEILGRTKLGTNCDQLDYIPARDTWLDEYQLKLEKL